MNKTKLSREKELETILTICVGLVVLYFVTKQQHRIFLTLSVLLGLTGMFFKTLTSKITWAWMKLSEGMGFVMSKVILSAVFFVFVLPVALLSRLFKKQDTLQLSRTKGDTYFVQRNHRYVPGDLENLW